jgi:peptide/nickel transport system substrate-binding protein
MFLNSQVLKQLRVGDRRIRAAFRPLAILLTTSAFLSAAALLPRLGIGQTPPISGLGGERDLLKSPPFDRITLPDNSVIKVEPVSPRPLPSPPAKKAKSFIDTETNDRFGIPREGNIGVKTAPKPKKSDYAPEIVIQRIDGEPGSYRLKRIHIKKIDYFEDMLLRSVDRLIQERSYTKAFEHLLLVKDRNPKWPGLDERVKRLLYEEGTWALRQSDIETGQRLLRELYLKDPKHPGLAEQLVVAYGERIDRAFERGAYREGRKVLHDLEVFAPDHDLVRAGRSRYIGKAQELLSKAAAASGAEQLDLAASALRVWPKVEGGAERFSEAFRALPTLDVGVFDVSHQVGPWVRSPADERIIKLGYLPILARDNEEAAQGRLPYQLAAELQATDLGRRLAITLKPGATWSDGSRPVTSMDVVRSLSDKVQPRSLAYNARWHDLLERVEAIDERQVVVTLMRAPLKPEAWLLGPIGPAHVSRDGQAPDADGGRRPVGDGPFRWELTGDDTTTFLAATPIESSGSPKIRRLREIRLSSHKAAVNALLRGDVSMLERIPPDRVAELSAEPDLQVGTLERPAMHFLAIDGRTPVLRNRTLRRAISYAIDRQSLLEESILRRSIDPKNCPTDGVFEAESYANAADVKPLSYDPLLARMLAAAAKKEMGGETIKLTFEYPAIPEAQASAKRLIDSIRRAGIEIKAIERPESELEAAIRSGRKFDLAYRTWRCVEPAFEIGPMLCPAYDAPAAAEGLGSVASPRILQLLLELEQAQSWPLAREIVKEIDRETRDEFPVIPLWRLEEHHAWRKRLRGPSETAESLYQEIDKWEIEPWFATDPW